MASQAPGNTKKQDAGPSEGLEAFLGNQSVAIKERLRRTLDTFLQYYRDNAEKETIALASNCCTEAQIWYWRMLESHVRDERMRRGREVSGLLQNDLFHCCLAACSLDIAIFLKSFPCGLPLLLQIICLPPYHFLKVIEPLLRSNRNISNCVFKHLCQVETQIVESLAWASDSPLWEEVRTNEDGLPPWEQVSSQRKESNIVLVDHIYHRPPKRTNLDMFAFKVYSLMGNRLQEQCRTLPISHEIRQKIWTCFVHSLVHFTDLMMDRHLDQLMWCAIYIVTKACKIVLNSIEDVENQSHGNHILTPNTPSTHHSGKELRRNLIDFYNQVYVTKLEPFVKLFQPVAGVETPPLSPYPPQSKPVFLKQTRICISPYNEDTPSPRSPAITYTFNSSNSECLKRMNEMLKRHTQTEEMSGDEPLVKRPRLRNDSIFQQQLRDLMDDRMTTKDQDCAVC